MSLVKCILTCFLFLSFTDHLIAIPEVTLVNPSSGSLNGGNVITIAGNGFIGATSVDFGGRPASSFNVLTDQLILVVVPVGTAGTVDITVTVGAQTSVKTRADFYTYTQDSWNGILSGINQDGITLFDTATNTINGFIPLPSDSLAAVITPDGKTIYAAETDQPSATVIDAATNTIITTIPTGVGTGSFDVIVNADGSRVYISNINTDFVTVVDTATNTVVANIFLAPNLGPLSITPDGKTVYVSNFVIGGVTTIDTATNTVGMSIITGITPGMISITPDGKLAYVANLGSDTVSVINIATNTVTTTIALPTGSGPYGSSILPNGKTLYVANYNNATVSVVDIATNSIVDTLFLTLNSLPFWVASTPDGKTVYVISEATDDVTPIDVATNTVGPSFAHIMGDIQDIVMSPDPAPVASFFAKGEFVGFPILFDASASISPIGTIVSYAWDFGDGITVVTNAPFINHTYTSIGNFNVTLTVMNSAGTSTSKVFSSRFISNNGGPTATLSQIVNILSLPPPPIPPLPPLPPPPFPILFPPLNVKGFQKANRFVIQTEYVNILTWEAPIQGTPPVAYHIYRDAALTQLIAVISSKHELEFKDHDRKKGKKYTYFIVSVNKAGAMSSAASITIEN